MKETAPLAPSKNSVRLTYYAGLAQNVNLSHQKNKECLPLYQEINSTSEDVQSSKLVDLKTCLKNFLGIILAIASGIFMSLTSVIVKKVDIFPGELGFVRFLCIAVFALPLAIHSGADFFTNRKILILILFRGFFDSFSIYFRFEAMQRLPLADANVIIFSSPVVVAVMARFILKERCSFYLILSLILTIMGLTLVVKLPLINSTGGSLEFSSMFHILGVVYGFASVFFNASMIVIVRKINKNLHLTVILFHLGWTASIISLVLTASFGTFTIPDPVKFEPWWLLLMGTFSLIGQLLMTAALQYEHAGPVAIARAGSDIVAAFIWQILFFAEEPDIFSVSGALMVTLGGVVLNLSKWVVALPDTSPTKKNLKCLTF